MKEAGSAQQYEYDTAGNITSVMDGEAHRTVYELDCDSIIVMSWQGIEAADDGAGWRYEYDQVGRLVRITDPEGTVQKRYIYDLHGWNNKCKGKNIFIWIE